MIFIQAIISTTRHLRLKDLGIKCLEALSLLLMPVLIVPVVFVLLKSISGIRTVK